MQVAEEIYKIEVRDYLESRIIHIGAKRYKESKDWNGKEVSEKVEIINVPKDVKKHRYSEVIKAVKDAEKGTIFYDWNTGLIETRYVNIKLSFSYNEEKVYFRFSDGRTSFRTLGIENSVQAAKELMADIKLFENRVRHTQRKYEG